MTRKVYENGNTSLGHIGERIREARIGAGLTQEELAGGSITRNMLSRIENGAALPSLPTLCAISDKLGLPVGALFGNMLDYTSFKLASELSSLLAKKRYSLVIEKYNSFCSDKRGVLCDFTAYPDFISYVLCRAELGRAWELFRAGRLSETSAMLEMCEKHCAATDFDVSATIDGAALCRMLISNLIPEKEGAQSGAPDRIPNIKSDDDSALRRMIYRESELAVYLYARNLLAPSAGRIDSQPDEKIKSCRDKLLLLISELPAGFIRSHIEAKLDMANAEYLDAKAKLMPSLESADKLPPSILYDVYTDLELCCKCCGDFENAYKYSGMKLELMKRIR